MVRLGTWALRFHALAHVIPQLDMQLGESGYKYAEQTALCALAETTCDMLATLNLDQRQLQAGCYGLISHVGLQGALIPIGGCSDCC